jgi:hypothetical protein
MHHQAMTTEDSLLFAVATMVCSDLPAGPARDERMRVLLGTNDKTSVTVNPYSRIGKSDCERRSAKNRKAE